MNYEEAKKVLLSAWNNNPAAHPELEQALETVLFEAVKAAGKKHEPAEAHAAAKHVEEEEPEKRSHHKK